MLEAFIVYPSYANYIPGTKKVTVPPAAKNLFVKRDWTPKIFY